MEVRKAIKKVVALATGASMVGATILGASAQADLANYPAPFIVDGVFDGILVVGDDAKPADIVGTTDIAMSLQFLARSNSAATATSTATESTSTVTAVTSDAYRIGTAGDVFEMQDSTLTTDSFNSALSRISASEMAALADGSAQSEKGTAPYEQFVKLGPGYVQYTEDDDTTVVSDYVRFANGDSVLNYTIEFTTAWESDREDSNGDRSTNGEYLTDFEDESIQIGGVDYTVLTARTTNASTGTGVDLTLLGGEVIQSLEEGQTKTIVVGDKTYEVEVPIITDVSPSRVELKVNGVVTRELREDQTTVLSDGTTLGILRVLPNEAGDVTQDRVTFALGAQKLTLQDNVITNEEPNNQELTVNEESVSTSVARAYIKGTTTSSLVKIDKIGFDVFADDEIYLKGALSEYPDFDSDAALVMETLGFDVFYGGLTGESMNVVELQANGDDRYVLNFINNAGEEVSIPLAYDNETAGPAFPIFGDRSYSLNIQPTSGNDDVTKNQYFIVTTDPSGSEDLSTYSTVLQYKGGDAFYDSSNNQQDSPELKFKNLGSGEQFERPLSATGAAVTATINLGGRELTVTNASSAHINDFSITLSGQAQYDRVVTDNGLLVVFDSRYNATGVAGSEDPYGTHLHHMNVTLVDAPAMMDSDSQPAMIAYTFSAATADREIDSTAASYSLTMETTEYDSDVQEAMNAYGVLVKETSESNDPTEVELHVPANQRLPLAYLTAGEITTGQSTSSSGSTGGAVVRIDVGSTRLASTVLDQLPSTNAIIVGGPCANAATAWALGVGEGDDCAAGFEEGKAMIKLVEQTNGKVALVIAGYSSADTTAAARVVANHDSYPEFRGTEVEVSNTASATPTVGAPTVAAAAGTEE